MLKVLICHALAELVASTFEPLYNGKSGYSSESGEGSCHSSTSTPRAGLQHPSALSVLLQRGAEDQVGWGRLFDTLPIRRQFGRMKPYEYWGKPHTNLCKIDFVHPQNGLLPHLHIMCLSCFKNNPKTVDDSPL